MLIQSETEVYRVRVPTKWYFKAELQIQLREVLLNQKQYIHYLKFLDIHK